MFFRLTPLSETPVAIRAFRVIVLDRPWRLLNNALLKKARRKGRGHVNSVPVQVMHIRDLIDRLGIFHIESASWDLDIRPLHGFYPIYLLKDQYGALNGVSIQIAFGTIVVDDQPRVVVLKFYEGNGLLPGYERCALVDLLIEHRQTM